MTDADGDPPPRPARPTPRGVHAVGDAVSSFLSQAGISARVDQASAVGDWASVAGPQIAAVTEARSVTQDGTLFIAVRSNGWMNELSLMEPELLRKLNAVPGRPPVVRLRYVLAVFP